MKIVAFDVKGKIAHFRRPDTTATHLTYPFITPTAVRGMVGAILGITDFTTNDKVGIQLLNPVETSSQQMSLLGKFTGTVMNRPTTQELLVEPAYRIYYAGSEYVDQLEDFLLTGKSVYPTYLGAAFALTKPIYYKTLIGESITPSETVATKTVVPVSTIENLEVEDEKFYSRAAGFLYQYLGDRTFDRSIDFIYEQNCGEIKFLPKDPAQVVDLEIELEQTEDGVVCLF